MIYTAVSTFPNLRSVHVPLPDIPSFTLLHLSMLPRLGTLYVSIHRSSVFETAVMTFRSLTTFGVKGSCDALLSLLNIMETPRLKNLEFFANFTTRNTLDRFCEALVQRVGQLSCMKLFFLAQTSAFDVSPVLKIGAVVTEELTIHGHTLSFRFIDPPLPYVLLRRLIVRGESWGARLPLTQFPDFLRWFPSLNHLEVGLDAKDFRIPTCPTLPYPGLKQLIISPGPIESALHVAIFLATIVPFASLALGAATDSNWRSGHLTIWKEAMAGVPLILDSISAAISRETSALQQEVWCLLYEDVGLLTIRA